MIEKMQIQFSYFILFIESSGKVINFLFLCNRIQIMNGKVRRQKLSRNSTVSCGFSNSFISFQEFANDAKMTPSYIKGPYHMFENGQSCMECRKQISYIQIYRNDPKFSDGQVLVNSADPDQTAPRGAVWSVSTLFAILSTSFVRMTL